MCLKDIQHTKKCENLLFEACKTNEQCLILLGSLSAISSNPDKYGLVEYYEGIMSMEDYYHISKLITFPKKTVVVDCGCHTGIQQVFFTDCYKYIGIDYNDVFQKINNNAEFLNGAIQEILPELKFEKGFTYIGVSHLCCSYFKGGALKQFKDKFDYLISI